MDSTKFILDTIDYVNIMLLAYMGLIMGKAIYDIVMDHREHSKVIGRMLARDFDAVVRKLLEM